jgi:hypothetical protein
MRRSSNSSSTSGGGSSTGNNSNDGDSGRSTVGLAGIFAEPFFPSLDEPGGGGDGWGFGSLLALRKALQAFPRREEQSSSSNSNSSSSSSSSSNDGNDGNSNGANREGAPDSKRQRTTDGQGGSNGSSAGDTSGAVRVPMLSPSPVSPLVLSPARAVLRGALVKCRALWDSLRPLEPKDLEGIRNLGPAFAFKAAAGPADDDDDDDDGSNGRSDDNDGRATGQGAGGATTGLRGPFLRRATTGDVAADALPFTLAQWPTAEVVAGPVDLLRVDLRSRHAALEHTAWLRPGRPDRSGDAVCDAAASATRSGNSDKREEGTHQGAEQGDALRPEKQPPQEEAHVLAVWVDYDLGPDFGPDDLKGVDDDGTRWLAYGPGVWHGRQGALALAAPLAFGRHEAALALRTCLTAAGRLTIDPAAA